MKNTVKVFSADHDQVNGAVGNVFIGVLRSRYLMQTHVEMVKNTRQMLTQYDGIALLTVIRPTATPPDDNVRAASAEFMKLLKEKLFCVAGVVEGTGMKAAAMRSIMTGLTFFARSSQPTKHFSD